MKRWKKWLPLVASVALVGWLVWRVSPERLLAALGDLNWGLLVPLSAVLVVGCYLWDAVCLKWLFHSDETKLSLANAVHARGSSYLLLIFNYVLGQAYLAWFLARAQNISLAAAGGRCVMMAYVDALVLLSLGLFGASISDDPRTTSLQVICAIALAALVGFTIAVRVLPASTIAWLETFPWGKWVGSRTWRISRIAQLFALRVVYFAMCIAYSAAGLWICGFRFPATLVLSVIPLVALVDGLPISASGLGTRETMLTLLLNPSEPAVLLAFSLSWSGCVIFGRGAIALGHLWIPRWVARRALR